MSRTLSWSRALVPVGLLCAAPAGAQEPGASPYALADAVEQAWKERDLAAYLARWSFPNADARAAEQEFAEGHLEAEQSQITIDRPASVAVDATRMRLGAQIFTVSEPRARAEEWTFTFERTGAGWSVKGRELRGLIDGLIHVSLDPQGVRADGLTFRLPDLELRMARGTLFLSPHEVGPTVLVFVGQGTLKMSPRPDSEREQMRQFCGSSELVTDVRAALLRIHPADFHRVLAPARVDPDPQAARRFGAARRFYDAHIGRSFVLEASLPRSPWWLLPGLGDASLTIDTKGHGTLTYALSTDEPEDVSLFDRARRRQISLYSSAGGDTRYSEDDRRAVDVLEHDIRLRLDPRRYLLEGEDTVKLRLRGPLTTLNLRLDEALRVQAITSREGGRHLFFRIRGQDSVMVSLGLLGGAAGEISLTVQYAGVLRPSPVEQELLAQEPASRGAVAEEEIAIEEVLVYTNRRPWYPRVGADDHTLASLRFDVPAGFTVVSGGTRQSARSEAGRTVIEYRQDRPGKYITAVVGRLHDLGARPAEPVPVHRFAVGRLREEALRLTERAIEVLRFFTEEFGPCPYPSLSLVAIEGLTPGGHSPPGTIVVAQRPVLLRGALRDDPASFPDVPDFFLAHELAHQWWGHGVAGQNYHERWISEGFAQYAAALWVRRSRGEAAFRDVLERMARWALRLSHEGPISLGHRLGHLKQDPQIFRAVVYNKGAYVLHMLRGVVGDEAFRTALRRFQEQFRYGKAGTHDLRELLEAASGLDLKPYVEQWVFGTKLPALRVSHRTEAAPGGFRTQVRIEPSGLPGPVALEIGVIDDSGRQRQRVRLEPKGGAFAVETRSRPRRVEVNTDRGLLARVSGS